MYSNYSFPYTHYGAIKNFGNEGNAHHPQQDIYAPRSSNKMNAYPIPPRQTLVSYRDHQYNQYPEHYPYQYQTPYQNVQHNFIPLGNFNQNLQQDVYQNQQFEEEYDEYSHTQERVP